MAGHGLDRSIRLEKDNFILLIFLVLLAFVFAFITTGVVRLARTATVPIMPGPIALVPLLGMGELEAAYF